MPDRLSGLLSLIRQSHGGDLAAERAALAGSIATGRASAEERRRAAWLAAACGEMEAAEQLLRQAQLQPDDQGESWFALGLLRLSRDEAAGAREAFVSAARRRFPAGPARDRRQAALRGYDPSRNRIAVFQIFENEFSDAFCCFLLLRRIWPKEVQAYEICVARAFAFLGHSETSASLLREELALNGETFWYHVQLGHYYWLHDRRAEADLHYGEARARAIRDSITPFHLNRGTLVWLTRAEAEAAASGCPAVPYRLSTAEWRYRFGTPAETQAEIVIAVGMDGNYFHFFPKFLLSVLTAHAAGGKAVPAALHCHLADPTAEQIGFLEQIIAKLAAIRSTLRLSYSTSVSEHARASYFTCLRFLALPEVLDFYAAGVLVLDVDCTLEPDFFQKIGPLRQYSFGLRMDSFHIQTGQQIGGEPWSIGAHLTYVSATPAGRRFAAFLRDYIRAAYDPELVTNWTIDQCAIAQAHDLLLRPAPDLSIVNLAHFVPLARLPRAGKLEFLREGTQADLGNFEELSGFYFS